MSTGAFLEFLTRLGCRDAGLGLVGHLQQGLGAAHKNSAGGACGPGLQGLGARAAFGAPPGAWGLFPTKLKLRFFANLLVGAWRRRGCRLKRLLRRWGPGGKRSRDTPPTPPPPPPTPAFWGCKGERKRVFTLSAFGNHPTRPPRSAD